MGNKRLAYSDSHRKTDLATGIANGIAILPGQPPAVEWRDTRRRRYSDTPRDLQHNFCQQLMRPEAPKVLPQPQLHGAAQKSAWAAFDLLPIGWQSHSRIALKSCEDLGRRAAAFWPHSKSQIRIKIKEEKIKNKIPWPRGLNTKLQKKSEKRSR